jgi:hypothetical protein
MAAAADLNEPLLASVVSDPSFRSGEPVLGIAMDDGPLASASSPERPTRQLVKGIAVAPSLCDSTSAEFVHHVLQAEDTLMGLAVRYGSDEGAIMRCNGLLTNDLDLLPLRGRRRRNEPLPDVSAQKTVAGLTSHIKPQQQQHEDTVLLIPILYDGVTHRQPKSVRDEAAEARHLAEREQTRRNLAIKALRDHVERRNGSQQRRLPREEAEYYLSENDWNVAAATTALEADEAWERNNAKCLKDLKKKR